MSSPAPARATGRPERSTRLAPEVIPTSAPAGADADDPSRSEIAVAPEVVPATIASPVIPPASSAANAEQKLIAHFMEVNGQDAYDTESIALGKLKADEYLALPYGLALTDVAPEDVGRGSKIVSIGADAMAKIFALNHARAPAGCDANKFALLRLEAVKMGMYNGQHEVIHLATPAGHHKTFLDGITALKDDLELYQKAAVIIPMCAEVVFRVYGHHYISSADADYSARYASLLKSCLIPEAASILPAPILYHTTFHWIGPARVWRIVNAQLNFNTIPEAIKIRVKAAPAGTALITTTAAVIEAMAQSNIKDKLDEEGSFKLDKISEVADAIKADPARYHKTRTAYKVAPLSPAEESAVNDAMKAAIAFAPVAQGYIEALFTSAALGNARALSKHANQNPMMIKRAKAYFRALARNPAKSVKELLSTEVAKLPDEE